MTLWMFALLPAAIALCLLVALTVAVVVRTLRGERWEVPLEGRAATSERTELQPAA